VSEWQTLAWPEQPPPPERVAWKYGVKGQTCFNVTVPSWMSDLEPGRTLSPHVEICDFTHYRPYMDMEQHRMIADTSDIMLINYGVHYLANELGEFRSTLEALLHTFKNITDCVLIYRETSAQHFDSVGGEYRNILGPKCVPHHGSSKKRAGRRNVWLEAAISQNYTVVNSYGKHQHVNLIPRQMKHEITVLPLYNFTAKLFDLHTGGEDCTHFCYTPHLWYPTWRHLRIVMDRLVVVNKRP